MNLMNKRMKRKIKLKYKKRNKEKNKSKSKQKKKKVNCRIVYSKPHPQLIKVYSQLKNLMLEDQIKLVVNNPKCLFLIWIELNRLFNKMQTNQINQNQCNEKK